MLVINARAPRDRARVSEHTDGFRKQQAALLRPECHAISHRTSIHTLGHNRREA